MISEFEIESETQSVTSEDSLTCLDQDEVENLREVNSIMAQHILDVESQLANITSFIKEMNVSVTKHEASHKFVKVDATLALRIIKKVMDTHYLASPTGMTKAVIFHERVMRMAKFNHICISRQKIALIMKEMGYHRKSGSQNITYYIGLVDK